jgi:hypothetical protein
MDTLFIFASFCFIYSNLTLYFYMQNKRALPEIDLLYPQSIISWQLIYVAVSIGFGFIGAIYLDLEVYVIDKIMG